MRFTDNAELTAENMTNTDILAGTDVSEQTDKKFSLAGLADWFLNRFTGLSLAGKNQSVKAALDELNSTLTDANRSISGQFDSILPSTNRNLDTMPTNGFYGTWWVNNSASDVSGTKPVTSGQGILFCLRQSGTVCRQVYIGITGTTGMFGRYYLYSGGTWTNWGAISL